MTTQTETLYTKKLTLTLNRLWNSIVKNNLHKNKMNWLGYEQKQLAENRIQSQEGVADLGVNLEDPG